MTHWRLLTAATYLSALTSGIVEAASADDWKSRSIYQIVTDRFARTDGSTSAPCDTSQRVYCGGSWQGIINELDYIQSMGFDAIWISPVVQNIDQTTPDGEAYHGYWTQNLDGLNSNFGSQSDLSALSSSLHSRGMFLMLDVVVNDFAALNDSSGAPDFSSLSPFNSASQFHPECLITDPNNQTNVEQCWIGDAAFPLPDLNTEDSGIVQTMNSWIQSLVQTYNVDGIRIDAAKHIRTDFWPEFVSSAGVFSIGEVLTDSVSYASGYTQVLDGILDYPTYFALTKAFNSPSGNLSGAVDIFTQSQNSYQNGAFSIGSFIENHDQPRFLNITSDLALVRNAITWTFTQDGIPIVYYGQEQGFSGGADPADREALWPTGYSTNPTQKPVVNLINALNSARKTAISRNGNFLSTKATFIPQSNPSNIVISKPPLLTLLTNVGSMDAAGGTEGTWDIPSSSGLFDGGTIFVDILTCNTFTPGNGDLSVSVQSGLPRVLIPTSDLSKSGALCPTNGNGATVPGRPMSLIMMGGVAVFVTAYLMGSPVHNMVF